MLGVFLLLRFSPADPHIEIIQFPSTKRCATVKQTGRGICKHHGVQFRENFRTDRQIAHPLHCGDRMSIPLIGSNACGKRAAHAQDLLDFAVQLYQRRLQ